MKSKKKTQPLSCLKNDKGTIVKDALIAEEMCRYFQSVFIPPTNNANFLNQSYNDDSFAPFFTEDDIVKHLAQLDANSSPGPDNIHPCLLKNCASSLSKPLFLIFSISLRSGVFPSLWKEANVTPIHKGGTASSAANYRPISILSSIAKIFEKIVSEFLISQLNEKEFLHPSQHGFVKGKSCLTNLLTSINHWTSAIDNHQSCDVIYLDFNKAFDTVDHSILLSKLQNLNLPHI